VSRHHLLARLISHTQSFSRSVTCPRALRGHMRCSSAADQ
jgi:hypothetical protein